MSKTRFSDCSFWHWVTCKPGTSWWSPDGPENSRWASMICHKPQKTSKSFVRKFRGSAVKVEGKYYKVVDVKKKAPRQLNKRSILHNRCNRGDRSGKRMGKEDWRIPYTDSSLFHAALRELSSYRGHYYEIPVGHFIRKKHQRKSMRSSHPYGG